MKLFPSRHRQGISLRYTVACYVATYIITLALTFVILGFEAESTTIGLVANALSLVLFVSAMAIVERRRFLQFIRCRPAGMVPLGSAWIWILLSIPLGFALRLAGSAVFVILEPAKALVEFNELISTNYAKVGDVTFLSVLGVIMGAVTEEFIDRRVILPKLLERLGLVGAVLCGGTFFGVMHFGYLAIFIGIFLSLVYLVSGRLWVCISIHVAGNMFYPLARLLEVHMDWAGYRLLSISLLAMMLVFTAWLFFKCHDRYPLWKSGLGRGD